MSVRRPSEDRQAGFTLIELLIVVAITGMLMVLAVTSFRAVNGGWRRLSAHSEFSEDKVGTGMFLRNLLSQCYPFRSFDADGKPRLSFKGNSSEIDFFAPLGERFGTDDIVQYRLLFTYAHELILAWRFDRPSFLETDSSPWSETIVATDIAKPQFFYFGAPNKHDAAIWQSSWDRSDALPQLIDLHLYKEPEEDIIVAPTVTALICDSPSRSLCPA